MSRVSYELADRPAALIVDLAAADAVWHVVDQEVGIADVLSVAPADEVERLVRRAVAEIRSHAAAAEPPTSEYLRQLAASVWRDFRLAATNAGEQPSLPGM